MGSVAALVLGCVLIYGVVVEFAIAKYGPLALDQNISIIVSGLLGALLVGGLTKFVVPLRTSGWFWAGLALAGILGGCLFSLVIDSPSDFLATVGYIGWQVAVCLALVKGTTSGSRI